MRLTKKTCTNGLYIKKCYFALNPNLEMVNTSMKNTMKQIQTWINVVCQIARSNHIINEWVDDYYRVTTEEI